jgi:hypothetical protein
LRFYWRQLNGSGSIATPTAEKSKLILTAKGTYAIELIVSDINGEIDKDTVMIKVQ